MQIEKQDGIGGGAAKSLRCRCADRAPELIETNRVARCADEGSGIGSVGSSRSEQSFVPGNSSVASHHG